jgi:hypothetical protein
LIVDYVGGLLDFRSNSCITRQLGQCSNTSQSVNPSARHGPLRIVAAFAPNDRQLVASADDASSTTSSSAGDASVPQEAAAAKDAERWAPKAPSAALRGSRVTDLKDCIRVATINNFQVRLHHGAHGFPCLSAVDVAAGF